MLVALRNLAMTQGKPTDKIYNDVVWLLNNTNSHPTFVTSYKQSDIIIQVQSDASYLLVTKAYRI